MRDSYNELREEYYTALQGSITLNAATVNVYDMVQASQDTPYIYFADFDFKEDSCKDNFNGIATLTLMVISKYTNAVGGSKDSDTIGNQILQLLHNDTYFTTDNFRVVTNKLIDNSTDKVPTKTGTRIVKTIVLEHYVEQVGGDLTRITDLAAADLGATQIDLTWSRVTGNTGYRVEYTNNIDDGWTLLVTNAQDTESYSHTGVTTDLVYYYRVRAFDSSGGSGWSNIAAERTETGVTLSGIHYQRPFFSGQTTSYRTYDEAWQFANGSYDYTPPSNPTHIARMDETVTTNLRFFTLADNNAFGNTNRFTDENGLQVFGNNYTIDHLTGLGIYTVLQSNLPWDTHIDNTPSKTTLGYTDFRMANINEINSLCYYEAATLFNYTGLSSLQNSNNQWTSSTPHSFSTSAYHYNVIHGLLNWRAKTNNGRAVYVRNHY
jgi:hypothetical protein